MQLVSEVDSQDLDFPMVFLDEASMATEPLSLVSLTKGVCPSYQCQRMNAADQLSPLMSQSLVTINNYRLLSLRMKLEQVVWQRACLSASSMRSVSHNLVSELLPADQSELIPL